jgi:vacuolar-type H+-ATPase subunit C/Vma6
VIKSTNNYEYVNALVRGQIGNLLKLYDYEAILGCSKPSDLIQVLARSNYNQYIAKSQIQSFEAIDDIVLSIANQNASNLIAISPKPARIILNEYRLLLESRSLVNQIRSKINRAETLANLCAIPLGAISPSYYKLIHAASEEVFFPSLDDFKLNQVIAESIKASKTCNSIAPLSKIVIFFCKRFLDSSSEDASSEVLSLHKLATSTIDAANLEIILRGLLDGIDLQKIQMPFLNYGGNLKEDQLRLVSRSRNVSQAINLFQDSRYQFCLDLRPNWTIDDLLNRLPIALCFIKPA